MYNCINVYAMIVGFNFAAVVRLTGYLGQTPFQVEVPTCTKFSSPANTAVHLISGTIGCAMLCFQFIITTVLLNAKRLLGYKQLKI